MCMCMCVCVCVVEIPQILQAKGGRDVIDTHGEAYTGHQGSV